MHKHALNSAENLQGENGYSFLGYSSNPMFAHYNNNHGKKASRSEARKNIEEAKENGTLHLEPKQTVLGYTTVPATYVYKPNGNESISEINAKFNLKDGALIKCNPYIFNSDWCPNKNHEIYFYKDDVQM